MAGNRCDKKLQMLLPQKLIPDVLKSLHDHPTSAHLGVTKTLLKVRDRFYWPGQRRDVEDWCRTCQECSSRKSPSRHYLASNQALLICVWAENRAWYTLSAHVPTFLFKIHKLKRFTSLKGCDAFIIIRSRTGGTAEGMAEKIKMASSSS